MNEEYGTDPEDIYSAIGPSICQECYEVSEDVILEFQKSFEKKYWDSLFYIKENGKYQLNLWEANRHYYAGSWNQRKNIFPCRESAPAAIRSFFFLIVHHMEKEEIWEHFLEYVENNIYKISIIRKAGAPVER